MRFGFSILLAVLAILLAGRIGLAEPLRATHLEARVQAAAGELKAARAKERATRDAQAILTHRIASLKRLDRKGADDAQLERLLRESIDADRALAAKIQDVRRWQQAVLQAIREAFGQIDARRRELRPLLTESHPLAARKAAEKEITDLREVRERLVQVLTRVKDEERHRDWADHVVAIDPLDGPSELADKGDVLALTQKKIEQKKALLAQLIREKQVARSARDFTTDANAADEDLRVGRVGRGSPSTLAADTNTRNSEDAAPQPVAAPPTDPQSGGVEGGFDSPPPPASPPPPPAVPAELDPTRADTNLGSSEPIVGVSQPKTPVAVTPLAAFGSSAVVPPKQVGPNLLLNLSVDELDADSVDLPTLEKYVAELESMRQALAAQAQMIKSRAQQIEKDEARAKSK